MEKILDSRNILQGYDGELWSEDGTFLAQVNTWQAQIDVKNGDYNPAGSPLTVAILQGYSIKLVFTETVVKDAMLNTILTALKAGKQPTMGFIGVLRGKDGSNGRYVFRGCVPDGSITIADVKPGSEINRPWSWRVNQAPDLKELLGA